MILMKVVGVVYDQLFKCALNFVWFCCVVYDYFFKCALNFVWFSYFAFNRLLNSNQSFHIDSSHKY